MTLAIPQERQQRLLQLLPIIWVGSIPLGVSIEAITLVLCLMAILNQDQSLFKIRQNLDLPWIYPLVAILVWTLLGWCWTPKINHESFTQFKKFFSFLLIPLLMRGFETEKLKDQALQAFLIASLIPFIMAIAKHDFAWHYHHDNDPGHLVYNHILTGFFVSFAAYLALEFWFKHKNRIYLLAFGLFSYQVLMLNTGKIGYLLYFSLILWSLWQKTPPKQRLYLCLLGSMGVTLLLLFSPIIHEMLLSLHHEILEFFQGHKATSFGFRVQFHDFARQIFKQHWLRGAGPGSYHFFFETLHPVPAWPYAPNVHSQYWLILSEQGLIGFSLWLWFCFSLFKTTCFNPFYQNLWRGLLLILAINSFTDNILLASPAYLLLAIGALSIAPKQE